MRQSSETLCCSLDALPSLSGNLRAHRSFLAQSGADLTAGTAQAACQVAIRQRLNPLFKVSAVQLRTSLPRTASNKIMRRVLRDEVMAKGVGSSSNRSKL